MVFAALGKYDAMRVKFEQVEKYLENSCVTTKKQVSAWKFSSSFFHKIQKVPLGAIPKVAKLVSVGSGSVERLFKVPSDKLCTTTDKVKTKLDAFDVLVSTKIQVPITKVNN